MSPRTESVTITGPAGALQCAIDHPAAAPGGTALGCAVFCHPHPLFGGTMDNKVIVTLARAFVQMGYVAVRFNFRGVGRSEGAHDDGIGETEDALAVIAWAREQYGAALPLALAGFSFGSYVQTRVAPRVDAERLVLAGPAVKRFPVGPVPADTIVIHGEEDDVVPLADVLDWARPQALPIVVFPGCGHFFHGRLGHLRDVVAGMWRRPPSVF